MKIARSIRMLLVLAILPLAALAREAVPIVDHNNVQVVTSSGKPATAEQVRAAIVAAAQSRKWEIGKGNASDVLSATLNVRGKHTVMVAIAYAADSYSIKYQNSINMKYTVADAPAGGSTDLSKLDSPSNAIPAGTPMIHPFYNRWVQDLLQGIQFELKKL